MAMKSSMALPATDEQFMAGLAASEMMANENSNRQVGTPDGKTSSLKPRPFRITLIRQETYDTFTLELTPADGADKLEFRAGQFNMLYHHGLGEVPISISGDPIYPSTLVHTIRAVGPVTKGIRKLKKGDIVGVRGPYGTEWPVEKALSHDVVIIAGGIGLAPLRPAIYAIIAERDLYGNIALLYGARTKEDILYIREIEQWRSRLDMEVAVSVDRSTGSWRGNVGVVTTLIPKATFDPHQTIAMICGPEIMMRFTVMELQKRGIEEENIFISMERNMKCGVGLCGHCQLGPTFICKDGPIYSYNKIKDLFRKREI
jgi:NAD(P)H-flavin reductase